MLKLIALLVLICLSGNIYAANVTNYTKYQQIYSVSADLKSFNKTINAIGYFENETYSAYVYFGELEKVESISGYYLVNSKKKKLSKNNIYKSDLLSEGFYDGYKTYKLDFVNENAGKAKKYFEYNANIINTEVFCVSKLNFYQSSDFKIDTFENIVNVPHGYYLLINIEDCKNEKNFSIDSNITTNGKTYIFRKYFSVENNQKTKTNTSEFEYNSIRVLVCPDKANPLSYFNNWYQNLINSIPPSEKYKVICDSLRKISPNRDSLIANVFYFVTKKIRYIDIENGINAFRPRQSDEVLFKQQGDCKDMALLLNNMYNYLGYDASMALSSTLNNDYNFDFPTLSSANHAICILKYDDKIYYLDATERLGKYNQPSQQIQSTKAMISKQGAAQIIDIPKIEGAFNKVISTYKIKIDEQKIKGNFDTEYKGYSKIFIENITENYSNTKSKQLLKKYYQDRNYNISFVNIEYIKKNESINIKGEVDLNPSIITKVENKTFLNFNFCPFIHSFEKEADSTENYPLYRTTKNKNTVIIEFPYKINRIESLYSNFKISEFDIVYSFNVRHQNNQLIIEYEYENPYVLLTKNIIPSFNKINESIKKTLNHEIIIY